MPSRRAVLASVAGMAGIAALGIATGPAVAGTTVAATARPVAIPPGSTGPNVASLQYLLTAFGYVATADGYYGPVTQDQVRRFQAEYRLVQDGDAGPITMAAMLDSGRVNAARGWTDSDCTRAVQTQLVRHGYEMLVDGDFGPLTETDLTQYQTGCALPGSGVADYVTWTHLFNPPASPGTGYRRGPAVLVSQSGSGLDTWAYDCGPAGFVAMQLRMGRTPGRWTDVTGRGAAIDHARRTDLHMYNDTRGTGQIGDDVGIVAGFERIGVTAATSGGFDAAIAALASGGIAMLGGDLRVAAAWNGRATGSTLHWISILDHRSSDGMYQVADPSSQYNTLVWVTQAQLAAFAASWGASVCLR